MFGMFTGDITAYAKPIQQQMCWAIPWVAKKLLVKEEMEETMKFGTTSFDLLQSKQINAGKYSRNCYNAPYRSTKDFRLKACTNCRR